MSSIDTRVVEAKFDNAQFQQGVQGTLSSLDQLKRGLNMDGASKSLDGLGDSAGRVKQKIDVMRIASLVAISTIAHQAVRAGENLIKSLTIDPIHAGLESYNEQINATQIILANTKAQGTTLKDVTATLAELQQYANLTVYSFSDMTTNIGRFTASGVPLKQATMAIKGMANNAALSGSTTLQMSTAMTQMSQALAVGVIHLQDWNSLANANMGGQNIQNALKATARTLGDHGKAMDAAIKKQGSFRNSLKEGWLTSDVYTKAMGVMAGTIDKTTGKMKAFSVEQLKHEGYTQKDAKALHDLSQQALNSAIQIRTMPQMMQALKEEVATAYGSVFKTIFGDINQATKLFTALHTGIENALTGPIYAFNKVLEGWAKLGGRVALLDGLKNGLHDVMAIINPIKDAFREIFPPATAASLMKITTGFRDLMAHLKIGATTANELKRTFAGLFAVIDIVWQLVKAGVGFLANLIGAVGKSSGGILKFTANIGDFLVALDKAIKHGDTFRHVFDLLGKVLTPLITTFSYTRIKALDLANGLTTGFGTFITVMKAIPKILHNIVARIHEAFNNLFGGFNFQNVLQMFNAGLFAGLLLLLRKFLNHLTREKSAGGIQGFIDKLTEPFHQLTNTLKEMQKAIQAATILEIAIAVGILAASVVALSLIDPKRLASALTGLTVMFGQVFGALALLNTGKFGAKGLSATAAGLILFATALRILTSSVVEMAKLDWEHLSRGLAGVAGLLAALVLTTKGMSGSSAAGMIRTGIGLAALAVGIKILASALIDLSGLSWQDMAKGLVGVGALLGSLAIFTKLVETGKTGVIQGAGLILLATGIKILASAVTDFSKLSWEGMAKGLVAITGILAVFAGFSHTVGNPVTLLASSVALVGISVAMNALALALKSMGGMSWESIGKGLVTMAAALIIISDALKSMEGSLGGAAALVLVSGALVVLSGALAILGSMGWENIAKGLIALAGSLMIISIAMAAMEEALPGAAALIVVAAALAILVPELALLGSMSWGDIAKGLLALAGVFLIVGVASAALSEAIPSILGLAGGIALLGLGLAAIGAGVYLFATGLQILALAGTGAAAAIAALVTTAINLLPLIATALGKTLVALAEAIVKAAPALLAASIAMIDGLLTAINIEGPKIIDTFGNLLLKLTSKLAQIVPQIATNALKMMTGFFKAVGDNAPRVIGAFTTMIVKLLDAAAHNAPRFIPAAVHLIVVFLNGIASKMGDIITAGANLVIKFIQGLGQNANRIVDAAGQTILKFLQGIDASVNKYESQIIAEGGKIAADLIKGLAVGIAEAPIKLGEKLGGGLLSGFNKITGRKSPAKEFIKAGKDINEGLRLGLVGSQKGVVDYWHGLMDDTRAALSNSADDIKKYTDRLSTLESAHKKNTKAINETKAALAEARKEHAASAAVLDDLNKRHDTTYAKLQGLGKQYDSLKTKIDNANQSLKDAIQVRDDYNKQVTGAIDTLPDIGQDTQLTGFENSLNYQINDAVKFTDVLGQLRKLGLNDTLYKQLVDKGPASLQLAEQLLEAGQNGIAQLDQLSDQLAAAAGNLGSTASKELYQAGVNAAQGIVNGLNSQLKTVENEMTKIAQALVKALKKELKIKSPSEVMSDLGVFVTKGVSEGMKSAIPHVNSAAVAVAKSAVSSLRDALTGLDTGLEANMSLNPTIAPVLDLSAVKKSAGELDTVLASKSITVDSAYLTAKDASAGYQANAAATQTGGNIPPASTTEVNFTQINQSPKALSTAEIYRNTNNQISKVKGALTDRAA